MGDTELWTYVLDHLKGVGRAVLLAVVAAEGETPGKPGFKMALAPGAAPVGTIGGGEIERQMVEKARCMLDGSQGQCSLIRQELRPSAVAGMFCGGAQTVALCRLSAADAATVRQILDCLRRGERGELRLCPDGLYFAAGQSAREAPAIVSAADGQWRYEEPVGIRDTVYIVGGGHVGLALSRILALLDVRIVVIDERPAVDTMARNEWATEKLIVPFNRVGEVIPDGEGSYVVIATPEHRADECVLRQLVGRRLRYLGMMGSATKVRHIFNRLRADSVPEEELRRVHAPIGLPIGSHTPAEIAISIAAEIIKVRNAAP